MAGKVQLRNSVEYLFSLGKSVREVWANIKANPAYKRATNKAIEAAIDRFQQGIAAAKRIPSASMQATLGTIAKIKGLGLPKMLTISFKFKFSFPPGSASGKIGNRDVFISESFPPTMTKREALDIINQRIKDWIARNYTDQGTGARMPKATITSMKRD